MFKIMKVMSLKEITKIAEELDWSVSIDKKNSSITFQRYSTQGQDFSFELEYNSENVFHSICSEMYEYIQCYNPNREALLWCNEDGEGVNGAPANLKDIIADMEECKECMNDLHKILVNPNDVKVVRTTKGILQYYRNWDNDGGIEMLNPQTLDKYKELKKGEAKLEGAFFAFGKTQFEEGYSKLVNEGYITEGEKIYQAGAGLYGTKEGLDKVFDYYKNKEKRIKEECDPQEVYFYEYNNHECMFTSDEDAIKEVKRIFGKEVVKNIKRIR